MRGVELLVLLAFAGGCHDGRDEVAPDAGLAPVDPNDPLIGRWDQVDGNGNATGTLVFEATGEAIKNEPGTEKHLLWTRLDEKTVRFCERDCVRVTDSTVLIDGVHMVIDGVAADVDTWRFAGISSCTTASQPPQCPNCDWTPGRTFETHWSIELTLDGAANGTVEHCYGAIDRPGIGTCTGTWTPLPFGIMVDLGTLWCDIFRHQYFRLGNVLAPTGYRRAVR